MSFHKVLFSRSGHGTTAGLIVDSVTVNPFDAVEVSKLFPWSAARFMRTLHVSPPFDTQDAAFAFVFPIDIEGNPVPRETVTRTNPTFVKTYSESEPHVVGTDPPTSENDPIGRFRK